MLLKHMPFPLESTSLIDVLQGSQILNRGSQTSIIALTINIVQLKCLYCGYVCSNLMKLSDYDYESR